jgi:acetyltransferase-like isoleucine patch superfamily enzyme
VSGPGITIAPMSSRTKRLPKLARGLLFRRHSAVVGGERLMVSGRISISTPHRGAQLVLGDRVTLGKNMKLYLDSPEARIEIGSLSGINRRTEIAARSLVQIGAGCAIGWDVCITDSDYHEFEDAERVAPVIIGDKVWIGSRATILKGVTIGSGAVIGAGAIITRDVPERALALPARSEVVRRDVSWQF